MNRTETIPGTKAMAQRIVNAELAFRAYAESLGLTADDALGAFVEMRKRRVLRVDAVNGTWHVKHGAFAEAAVIQRAADIHAGRA